MDDLVAQLARSLVLGALLDKLQRRFGGYDLVAHWTQGEFHHDVVIRLAESAASVLPGRVLVVGTNCNGGVKEVLAFADVPDRRALWHRRCPDIHEFTGELGPILGRTVTEHWFDPCELLAAKCAERAASRVPSPAGGRRVGADRADMRSAEVNLSRPWVEVAVARGKLLEAELTKELSVGHILGGRVLRSLAARVDADDVLVAVSELGYAVVHLTWSGRREASPEWPRTEIFASLDEWRMRRMLPDAEAHALGGDGQLRPAAYDAMTVNERLFAAGLIDDFDRAVRATDVDRLRMILRSVGLSDDNADAILRQVLPR